MIYLLTNIIIERGMILSMLFVIAGYAVVSVIDYIRIRKIPMSEALKNAE